MLAIGSLHDVPSPKTDLPLDKVAHFGMYGVLGGLAAHGWVRSGRRPAPIVPLLFAVLVGASDELHQRSVEGRTADWLDFAADVAGVGAGFFIVGRRSAAHNRENMHEPGTE